MPFDITLIIAILTGIVSGAIWGISGYFVAKVGKDGKRESFDKLKFGRAVIAGALVGGVAGYLRLDFTSDTFTSLMAMYPISAVADFGIKFLQRLFTKAKA